MKLFLNKLILLLFIAPVFPHWGSSQTPAANGLSYEVNRIHPSISMSKEELKEAQSLLDLNPFYKPSWIRNYLSVEITASQQGKLKKVVAENATLSKEQKDLMNSADVDQEISVRVHYIPENTLKNNPPKELHFSFSIIPESEASYVGGQHQLQQYLKEQAIDKIPDHTFQGYALAAVKFTIEEDGQISNAHVFESSKDAQIDELLLTTIRNMPCWKPAEYANGIKVKQEFALIVGNMESCVINLLNIRRD